MEPATSSNWSISFRRPRLSGLWSNCPSHLGSGTKYGLEASIGVLSPLGPSFGIQGNTSLIRKLWMSIATYPSNFNWRGGGGRGRTVPWCSRRQHSWPLPWRHRDSSTSFKSRGVFWRGRWECSCLMIMYLFFVKFFDNEWKIILIFHPMCLIFRLFFLFVFCLS